jgi:hypothetical protein
MTTLALRFFLPKKALFILRRGILFYFIFCGCNGGAKFRPPNKKTKTMGPSDFFEEPP